jgi:hypothetical protein
MKRTPLLYLACLAPLFLSAEGRGTVLSFAPAAGLKLRKTIVQTSDMSLDSMTFSINGEEHDIGEFDQSGKARDEYVFVDEYTAVQDGELRGLVRAYDKISETQSQSIKTARGEQSVDREAKTDLEGKTVAFTWDAESSAWKKEYQGEGADEALLAGLEAEFDLVGFLPSGEVSDGDEWEIPSAALQLLQFPGGALGARVEDEPESERKSSEAMRENFEGQGKGTFKGVREEDGLKLAVIEFSAEIDSAWQVDLEGRMASGTEDRRLHFTLKGELLWDTAARHAHSATIEREGSLEMSSASTMNRGEQSFEMKRETVLKLTGKDELKFEPPE